jgi:hypothetical protein
VLSDLGRYLGASAPRREVEATHKTEKKKTDALFPSMCSGDSPLGALNHQRSAAERQFGTTFFPAVQLQGTMQPLS